MDIKIFKQGLLDKLYAPYQKCTQCPLGSLGRTQVVFGTGNPDADIMLIGEGPGAQEDKYGQPFIGRSGQLLTRLLAHHGLSRNQLFITNVVKCRPPNNRAPFPLEQKTCKNILLYYQINIIAPHLIITLGATALTALLDQSIKISETRGTILKINNMTLMPTFHPAYILRNPGKKELLLQDIKNAIEFVSKKNKK